MTEMAKKTVVKANAEDLKKEVNVTEKPNAGTDKKPAVKKTASLKKSTPAKSETNVFIQFNGKEFSVEDITKKVMKEYGRKTGKDIKIYIKPEDDAAYYADEKNHTGKVDL